MLRGFDDARRLLSGRDWAYLLCLLVPVALYGLALKALSLTRYAQELGFWEVLELLRSDLLFDAGYAALWVGLFTLFRHGHGRAAALVLLHLTAVLIVVIETCAFQYLETTGTTLDYSVVAYYLSTPGEAAGAVSSETPLYAWAVLSAAILYALAGPVLLLNLFAGRDASPLPEHVPGGRTLTRGRFIAASLGAGAGVFLLRESLLPVAAQGQAGSVSRSPVSNLIATRIEEVRMEAAAAEVEALNRLSDLRLRATPRTRKRHIALIHLESVRERSVTAYNEDLGTMPFVAELAADSLLVERAYTTTPHTSKAITSINAGLFPHPDTEIIEARPGSIPARCLPELLAEHGYRSAWFQSATQKFEDRAVLVENFGYDHFQAYESMPTEGFQMSNYLGYEDDIMLGPSRRWLEENAGHPTLVMYLGVTPHHEYRPVERYGRKDFAADEMLDRYLNNVYYDDFWVSNIILQYRELGLYEDTVFVIYGDHGEAFGEHGKKGHDPIPYEEVLRVPLVIHAPGIFDGGARIEGPVCLMDFCPTLIDMLGFEVEGGSYWGRSFLRPVPEERTLLFSCRPDMTAMASIRGFEKYIYHYGRQPDEVYDLRSDPFERRNLARRFGKVELERRREELLKWHARAAAVYEPQKREKV